MSVDPAFRCRGVGTRLLEVTRSIARARGVTRLRVGVISGNVRAVAFYKRVFGMADAEVYLEADV